MNFQTTLAEVSASALVTATSPLVTGSVLLILLLAFLAFFLVRGVSHWFRLSRIQRHIGKFESNNVAAEFKKVFAKDTQLAHLWKEYQDSLHIQKEERNGQMVTIAVRATVPAELYFNNQYVVDSRLYTEFFKHLPGIFTGIGIIGTFGGLISGLQAFKVSENAALVRTSLESLMHSVGEAFMVSAAAIFLAMLATFLEKIILTSLYRLTEKIAHAIDAQFDAGAGEEYLSRLVSASEDSASQSKILKDALVNELGELLRELTSAQIASSKEQQDQLIERLVNASREQVEAARQDNQLLGEVIAESIQTSLQGPLTAIADTVKSASGDQSANAVGMLQDVMASFSQRLNELFGGQIAGLSDLNQQTARSIQEAVTTLQTLVTNIEESSQRSTNTMAERMAQAIEKMEVRQDAMNAQSAAFVEQIRQLVASSQSETNQKLQATLETIGTQVASMLAALIESQTSVFESNRSREQLMMERAQSAVSGMSSSVEAAIAEMSSTSAQMAQNVAHLTQSTSTSIEKMNAGVAILGEASRNFANAGDRVSGVMGQAADLTSKLSESAKALTFGATSIQEQLRDYKIQRDAVSMLVNELRSTVDIARKEASLTGDILNRLENSAVRLGVAQKQADEYLDGVSRVLGDAHQAFATEVTKTLNTANHGFHTKLTTAVSMLAAAIGELESTLMTSGMTNPVKGK